ncbi:hypothetical protein [Cellulomonas sp.]|uniref:hypothetical protein n=1 Tax=Cellulomonas sp. TaxID=40001 RepID=UPI00281273E2|nr:hypothetical protein [Cellulomonas sp.]
MLDDVLWTGDAAERAATDRDRLEQGFRAQLAALDDVESRIAAAWSAAVCTPPPGALPHEGGAPW